MDSWKNIEKPLGCAEILKTLKHIKEKYSTNFFNPTLHIPINETLKSPYILWLFTQRSSTRGFHPTFQRGKRLHAGLPTFVATATRADCLNELNRGFVATATRVSAIRLLSKLSF